MLETALKIELFLRWTPKKAIHMEKEKVKSLWNENFKDFAIYLTVSEYGNFIDFILHVVR